MIEMKENVEYIEECIIRQVSELESPIFLLL